MKKITSLTLAALTAGLALGGCGLTKDDDDSSSDKGKSSDYKDIIENYFDTVDNGDIEKALKLMYPDDLAKMLEKFGDFDTNEEFQELMNKDIEVLEIKKENDFPDESITEFSDYLGKMKYPLDLMAEYGLKSMDDIQGMDEEKLKEMQDKYSEMEENFKSPYNIDDAYLVNVKYKVNDDEKNSEMLIYYVDGEGWKVDESMWKYINKSKKASSNSSASTLGKGYASALCDIENRDAADVSGTYIICSDSSKNVNVPDDLDIDKLDEYAENYFDKKDDFDYFVVIEDGCTVFSALNSKNKEGKVGTFPANSIPVKEDDHISSDSSDDKEYSLDELYDMAVELVK